MSSAADPMPSREYPSTYSSRRAPWYDPLRIFTSAPKAADPKPIKVEAAPLPIAAPLPMAKETFRPIETPAIPVFSPTTYSSAPAWKWYGYGTPSHNGFANGWQASTGATAGSVPLAPHLPNTPIAVPADPPKPTSPSLPYPVRPEAPLVVVPPTEGPKLHETVVSPPAPIPFGVDWKPVPSASLTLPVNETPTVKPDGPRASLRGPVAIEEKPVIASPEPSTPASQFAPPNAESKEIPVVPAPGIVAPK